MYNKYDNDGDLIPMGSNRRTYDDERDDPDSYAYEEPEPPSGKPQIEYKICRPIDAMVEIRRGMLLYTDDCKVKVIKYLGSEVYHQNLNGNETLGYAPKTLPDANEWRQYKMLVEKV